MERFLIEAPHGPKDCAQAAKIFMESGSHFMTHADHGCKDGEHQDRPKALMDKSILSIYKPTDKNVFSVSHFLKTSAQRLRLSR